jgi:monothiol glutaredoxin
MTAQDNNTEQDNNVATLEKIKNQIADNQVLLYMKGKPQAPQCGFSATAVKALAECGVAFAFVNILDNPDIRANLPAHSNWPTFPQLFIKGELIGGSDIISEMQQNGELAELLKDITN